MDFAEPRTASWMIATLGTPSHSSSIASRKLRALQEPQPPKPVIATETSEVRRAQSAGSGATATRCFSTRTAPLGVLKLLSSS